MECCNIAAILNDGESIHNDVKWLEKRVAIKTRAERFKAKLIYMAKNILKFKVDVITLERNDSING